MLFDTYKRNTGLPASFRLARIIHETIEGVVEQDRTPNAVGTHGNWRQKPPFPPERAAVCETKSRRAKKKK